MIRLVITGPTPASDSSSFWLALLTLTRRPEFSEPLERSFCLLPTPPPHP
jgi:hypothetical protein